MFPSREVDRRDSTAVLAGFGAERRKSDDSNPIEETCASTVEPAFGPRRGTGQGNWGHEKSAGKALL